MFFNDHIFYENEENFLSWINGEKIALKGTHSNKNLLSMIVVSWIQLIADSCRNLGLVLMGEFPEIFFVTDKSFSAELNFLQIF